MSGRMAQTLASSSFFGRKLDGCPSARSRLLCTLDQPLLFSSMLALPLLFLTVQIRIRWNHGIV